METRQFSPENQEGSSTGDPQGPASNEGAPSPAESQSEDPAHPHGKRRRRRIKIRKRIRMRKKPSTKKKVRKIAETLAWVAIVAGFIITLIIMIKELDIKDEKFRQMNKGKKTAPSRR